jgi:uncharacterized protein with von Willebrand factor type A (vWA) domain
LRQKDIGQFSAEELEQAKRIIHNLVWRIAGRPTRRKVRALKRDSYLDLRRTVRNSLDIGGEIVTLEWRQRKIKPRPLVVICDISGSMERYSRWCLHFLYALTQGHQRVEVFVFGTRLTRLTPALRHRDVDMQSGTGRQCWIGLEDSHWSRSRLSSVNGTAGGTRSSADHDRRVGSRDRSR